MTTYILERTGVPYDERFFSRWPYPRRRNEPTFTGPDTAATYEIREEAEWMRDTIERDDGRYCRVVDAAPHMETR